MEVGGEDGNGGWSLTAKMVENNVVELDGEDGGARCGEESADCIDFHHL